MIYTLKNNIIEAKIDTLGAELISVLGADGFEYVWSGDAWGDHSPVLFPLCGKILDGKYTVDGNEYKMAGHGFAKLSEFKLESAEADRVVLTLSSSEKTLAIYPFEFKLTADYKISNEQLTAVFTVENKDNRVLPYMFGWHPGFVLGGSADIGSFSIDFGSPEALKMHPLSRDDNGPLPFPSGETTDFPLDCGKYRLCENQIYYNDTLILTGSDCHCRLSGEKDTHIVDFSWSGNLPYFCIWKSPDSRARFICLEPWSDIPSRGILPENFDTRKMSRLSPNERSVYTYNVYFK